MKVTTMPKVLDAIVKNQHRITVDPAIASRAKLAIDRMVSIGGTTPTPAGPGVDPGE
jgi:quinolinate synthase